MIRLICFPPTNPQKKYFGLVFVPCFALLLFKIHKTVACFSAYSKISNYFSCKFQKTIYFIDIRKLLPTFLFAYKSNSVCSRS